MTPELIRIIVAIAGVIAVFAAVLMWWMNRTPHVERNESGVLPLFGGVDSEWESEPDVGIMDGGTVRLQTPYERPTTPSAASLTAVPTVVTSSDALIDVRQDVSPEDKPDISPENPRKHRQKTAGSPKTAQTPRRNVKVANSAVREFVTGGAPAPQSHPPETAVVSQTGVPGTMVEGQLLRFSIPAEGTLQFLPGRLEIASGFDSGREIRFVRVPGPHELEVTFGRSEGELYRHIQLRDQTVSRAHARMRLKDGRWMLMNQSHTNPVVRNGVVLEEGSEQELDDGDRIEMGEVLFTFRSR